jgi:hypothetical membrane protein
MTGSRDSRGRMSGGWIWTTTVLLIGVVVLAAGYYSRQRIVFYGGLFLTLAGVLTGIQKLIGAQKSER